MVREPQTQTAPSAPADGGVEPKPLHIHDPTQVNGSASASVEPNYQYWRSHGGEWADAYDQRKKRLVLYHIQELMLTQYMLQHAISAPEQPLRVLEFGCGVGRHLRNITRLPGIDVYGYDQSQAMVQGILRWAGRPWFDTHIKVGMPTGRLPYPDKHFDIVYSAEVLVHVRPEHIDGILSELVRVCRGHVLHMETSEHMQLVSSAHDGCWRHDLVSDYARLGHSCEVLPSGYAIHAPYRVKLGQEPRFTWAPAILDMYRRLERDMDEGFAASAAASATALNQAHLERQQVQQQIEHASQRADHAQHRLDQVSAELEAARSAMAAMTNAVESHAARADELNAQLMQAKGDQARELARAAELSRLTGALRQELAASKTRCEELEKLWTLEKSQAQELAQQRHAFVSKVARHLRH